MEHFGDTLRREDRRATSDPAPLPLLPTDGDSFLNGSIEPQEYLIEKRAQERQKALFEIEENRVVDRSLTSSALAGAAMAVVALANVAIVLSAIFKNYFEVALAGLVIVILSAAIVIRQFFNVQRLR